MAFKSTDYTTDEKQLAAFSRALAHPARIAILKLLASQDTCYCGDIVEELPIAQSTVSQHLKELKDSGLIQGSIEPPKVRYCIDQKNWETALEMFRELFSTKNNLVKDTK